MTRDLMEKLLAVVDAKIATHNARESSDGGLAESADEHVLVRELLAMCEDGE